MDPVTEALEILRDLAPRVARIEKIIDADYAPDPKPQPEPQKPTGGIYDFQRPAPNSFRHGLGVKMYHPDVDEFIERSRYAVRYSGYLSLSPAQENEAWAEIEAIQTGDPAIIKAYADAGVDPLLIAVLLMQGEIHPVKYDGPTFGIYAAQRAAYAHKTPQSWIENEFAVMGWNPTPSGGEPGE